MIVLNLNDVGLETNSKWHNTKITVYQGVSQEIDK